MIDYPYEAHITRKEMSLQLSEFLTVGNSLPSRENLLIHSKRNKFHFTLKFQYYAKIVEIKNRY